MRTLLAGIPLKDSRGPYTAKAEAVDVIGTRVNTQTVPRSRKRKWKKKQPKEQRDAPPQPNKVEYMTVSHSYTDLRITMKSGRFRVVRRMLASVGLGVVHLHRSAIGYVRREKGVEPFHLRVRHCYKWLASLRRPIRLLSEPLWKHSKLPVRTEADTSNSNTATSETARTSALATALSIELAPEEAVELRAPQRRLLWSAIAPASTTECPAHYMKRQSLRKLNSELAATLKALKEDDNESHVTRQRIQTDMHNLEVWQRGGHA